jgi:hypothetical protein
VEPEPAGQGTAAPPPAQAAGELEIGELLFEAPTRMREGEEVPVAAVLGVHLAPDKMRESLEELLAEADGGDSATHSANLKVGPYMIARLTGLGFAIEPNEPWRQQLRAGDATTWLWQVRAKEAGQRMLTLRFDAEYYEGGSAVHIRSLVRHINVDVKPAELSSWERVAIYGFGVLFVAVILALAFFFPRPTAFQYVVVRIVLALATAAVATLLSGFLQVQVSEVVKAGGAFAVFVIVYFYSPARLVARPRTS